jgi:predicted RNA-binding protein YlxR (DUF448 family)
VLQQDALVRFVLGPDQTVHVDYRHKLPGRGAYTCIATRCLDKACKEGRFGRAFRCSDKLQVSYALLQAELVEELRNKVESLIGMARKSRQFVGGSQQVIAGMDDSQRFGLILLANDISPAIGERIQRKADALQLPVKRLLAKEQLGRLTGRVERSALAVQVGPLCDSLQQEFFRYEQIVGEY